MRDGYRGWRRCFLLDLLERSWADFRDLNLVMITSCLCIAASSRTCLVTAAPLYLPSFVSCVAPRSVLGQTEGSAYCMVLVYCYTSFEPLYSLLLGSGILCSAVTSWIPAHFLCDCRRHEPAMKLCSTNHFPLPRLPLSPNIEPKIELV